MEKLFELTFQDQTLNPQVGTYTNTTAGVGTFTLEDGEYYLTNGGAEGFYTYAPIAIQPDSGTDNKITVEFDLKVLSVSALTHAILGSFDQLDINDAPVQTCWLINYDQGDIEFAHSGGSAVTLIAAADVVVDQWYHFKIECSKGASPSTFDVDIDGSTVATITSTASSYKFDILAVLGTGLHACDECGIKNIRLITDDDYFVGRTALNQAFKDTKGYVDTHCMDLTSTQTAAGDKTFSGTTTTHDVIPATTDTYDLGSSATQWNNAYIKTLTVNGTAAGDILTHDASEFVPRSGGAVISGTAFSRTVNDSSVTLCGGTGWDYGASITLSGKDRTNDNGAVILRTKDSSNVSDFVLRPNGTATWGNKNLAMQEDTVPRSGGPVMAGQRLSRTVDNDQLNIDGGSGGNGGSSIALYGKDIDYLNSGGCTIVTHKTSTYLMNIFSSGSWTWTGQAVQLISDQRYKQQINAIDDKLLDAWESVELCQFKYNDAVNEKGDNARLHTGYVVQQIEKACTEHDVDVSAYGLYCHEEYPEETEEVEVLQKDGTKAKERKVIREANEHYSLRYTEVYAVECMYLRRCISRLVARIEQLEKGNNIK